MQYKRLSQLSEGVDKTAQPVRQNGSLLVPANAIITPNLVHRLRILGYGGIYVISDEEEATFFSYEEEITLIESLKSIYNSKLNDAYAKDFVKALDTIEEVVSENISKIIWNDNLSVHTYKVRGKADYDFYHALSVCALCITVGKELNLKVNQIETIAIAALLHDMGKGALFSRKVKDLSEHPRIMAEILKARHYNIRVALAIQQHHELLDGTGYPSGLKDDKICLEAQILSVCDVYDNHANPRRDSSIQGEQEALEFLFGAGGKYNSQVVYALSRCVRPFPVGTRVKLSSHLEGVVCKNYKDFPLRPDVNVYGKVYELNKEHLDTTILEIVDKQ